MNASTTVRTIGAPAAGDDERALLARFEQLLEREDRFIVARDAVGLASIADERAQLIERLATAARERRASPAMSAAAEAELIDLYRRLRQRHDLRARIVRRHAERNASRASRARAGGRQDRPLSRRRHRPAAAARRLTGAAFAASSHSRSFRRPARGRLRASRPRRPIARRRPTRAAPRSPRAPHPPAPRAPGPPAPRAPRPPAVACRRPTARRSVTRRLRARLAASTFAVSGRNSA